MRYLFLFSFCLNCASLWSQPATVRYEELTYSSDFEKKVFDEHFLDQKSDYFRLYMANGAVLPESAILKAKEKFYAHLQSLDNEKFRAKKGDKKVKIVMDSFNDVYLKKYQASSRFEDIFINGSFDVISHALLFGLAFHELDIPFQIKERDNGVYIIAYPGAEEIIVEPPTEFLGKFIFNAEFKTGYVNTMREQKLITADEFRKNTVDALFEKYYLANQVSFTLEQMVGVHYHQEAMVLAGQEKTEEAWQQLEKAYLFMPSERISYLLFIVGVKAFADHQVKDEAHAVKLAKLSRFKKYGITTEHIQSDFTRVINELLFEKSQKDKLEVYYQTLDSLITDKVLNDEIAFIHVYENARFHYNQARFKDALPYLEQALQIKPTHQDANTMFIQSMMQSMKNSPNPERLSKLLGYSEKFPDLLKNNYFNGMVTGAYLIEMQELFHSGKTVQAEKYRTGFETFITTHEDIPVSEHLLGQAYSSAAVHYYKKGQNAKAKSVVAKGLEISPENYQLKLSLRMIN